MFAIQVTQLLDHEVKALALLLHESVETRQTKASLSELRKPVFIWQLDLRHQVTSMRHEFVVRV
jgi:hypothetical protein